MSHNVQQAMNNAGHELTGSRRVNARIREIVAGMINGHHQYQ